MDVVQHEGAGRDPERQEGPHVHFARPSPDGRWVFVADLGIDQVIVSSLPEGFDGENKSADIHVRPVPGRMHA